MHARSEVTGTRNKTVLAPRSRGSLVRVVEIASSVGWELGPLPSSHYSCSHRAVRAGISGGMAAEDSGSMGQAPLPFLSGRDYRRFWDLLSDCLGLLVVGQEAMDLSQLYSCSRRAWEETELYV